MSCDTSKIKQSVSFTLLFILISFVSHAQQKDFSLQWEQKKQSNGQTSSWTFDLASYNVDNPDLPVFGTTMSIADSEVILKARIENPIVADFQPSLSFKNVLSKVSNEFEIRAIAVSSRGSALLSIQNWRPVSGIRWPFLETECTS